MQQRWVLAGPIIEVGLKLNTPSGRRLLAARLAALASEDSALSYSLDEESELIVLRGRSEDHLGVAVHALSATFDIAVGTPQARYRECVVRPLEVDTTHKRILGPKGDFARVKLRLEPGDPDSEFLFENGGGDAVPLEYIPGILKGLAACRASGVLAGFPLVGFKATLIDGAHHEIDSSINAFEAATRAAFQRAKADGAIVLLEPVMCVEISGLQQHRDAFIADLNARRATVERGEPFVIRALVPLARMIGYRKAFASLAGQYGRFSLNYSHHQPASIDDGGPGGFRPAAAFRA